MAKKSPKLKLGATVELADKDVGFFDAESGLKIVRSQKRKLKGKIGRKTNRAILSGALLVVSTASSKSKTKKDDKPKGAEVTEVDLPEDLPGRDAFIGSGIVSLEAINKLSSAEIEAINGIGPKTIEDLDEYFDNAKDEVDNPPTSEGNRSDANPFSSESTDKSETRSGEEEE